MERQENHYTTAYKKTMQHEGAGQLANNPHDPGKMTYSGISRRYWPDWEGWMYLDTLIGGRISAEARAILDPLVKDFYRINFWQRIQGDRLAAIAPEVAYEVFDSAVNIGVSKAVEFLQTAHNIASGYAYELEVDGRLGPKTLETISRYLTMQPGNRQLNEEILLNCQNGEQYIHYKNNPNHKRFRGWFRRL